MTTKQSPVSAEEALKKIRAYIVDNRPAITLSRQQTIDAYQEVLRLIDGLGATAASGVNAPDVDWLAKIIRRADGSHNLGATALAEKIVAALLAAPTAPAQQARPSPSNSAKLENQDSLSSVRERQEQPVSEQNARFAIDATIDFGRNGCNKPPSDAHWLMPYWEIGRQLRQYQNCLCNTAKGLQLLETDEQCPAAQQAQPLPAEREARDEIDEGMADFNAKRLRRVCNLVGLGAAVPADDATLLGCMGSVLGMIARKIEERDAIPAKVDHQEAALQALADQAQELDMGYELEDKANQQAIRDAK